MLVGVWHGLDSGLGDESPDLRPSVEVSKLWVFLCLAEIVNLGGSGVQ